MLGDPRQSILKDIELFTTSTLALKHFVSDVAVHYQTFNYPDANCMYLILVSGERLLAYGMELDLTPVTDFSYLFDEDSNEPSPLESRVSLFCRRFWADNPYQIAQIIGEESESVYESLDHVTPRESETNEDFFLRNAMWLLNPTVH